MTFSVSYKGTMCYLLICVRPKPVGFQASLLTAITDNGLIAGCKLCPSDTHDAIDGMLEECYLPGGDEGVMREIAEVRRQRAWRWSCLQMTVHGHREYWALRS
jgi:hypothetical protein